MTLEAIMVPLSTFIVAVLGAIGSLILIRSNARKNTAEAKRVEAEAAQTTSGVWRDELKLILEQQAKDIARLSTDNDDLRAEHRSLREDYRKLLADDAELNVQLKQMQAENIELTTQVQLLQTNNRNTESQLARVRERLTELETQGQRDAEYIVRLRAYIGDLLTMMHTANLPTPPPMPTWERAPADGEPTDSQPLDDSDMESG